MAKSNKKTVKVEEVKHHPIPDIDREKIKLIADKAKRMRTDKKISYEEFARTAEINRNSYFRFEKSAETGENFTVALLLKVIRGLKLTPSEFFQDIS
jgi:transcriptional regulator with XRE-family HTH domain